MAEANKLENKSSNVIAVIGDGAISAGMAYEAMNNAGASKTKMIVILNDNDMTIAKPVGAMRTYLAKLFTGKIYFSLRETLKLITSAFSKRFSAKAGKAEDFFRSAVTGGTLFNSLGFYYAGPIDGHDLSTLVPILRNARDSKHEGPIMIHIKTQKGKGYSYAEKASDHYHGVSKFNVETGEQQKSGTNLPISIFSSIEGSSTPIPVPLGYLIAQGLSLISTDVLIIFTNSASSLAAITIKFGKVAK